MHILHEFQRDFQAIQRILFLYFTDKAIEVHQGYAACWEAPDPGLEPTPVAPSSDIFHSHTVVHLTTPSAL